MFKSWEEEIVSPERGRRVVHFYLHDTCGNRVLAVKGTERSVRHMTYAVPHSFVDRFGDTCQVQDGTKWRSRREAVDWLLSLLSPHHPTPPPFGKSADVLPDYDQTHGSCGPLIPQPSAEMLPRKLKAQISGLVWNGVGWLCAKQLMHYSSFCRNGVRIAMHSFVFIMAVEGNSYIGFIEDMYEDKKAQKKVKVRWFHRVEEVMGVVSQLNAHPREVFITSEVQVISAECIDGPASVLTPRDYEQCVDVLPHSILCRVHMCFRQLKNNMIQPFSLIKLHGYSNQAVLSCINHPLFSKKKTRGRSLGEVKHENCVIGDVKQGHKRKRLDGGDDKNFIVKNQARIGSNQNMLCTPETSLSALGTQVNKSAASYPKLKIKLSGRVLKHDRLVRSQPELSSSFRVNDEIELLCQDSGIRGCWFRCKVLKVSRKFVKVEYDDLEDAENSGNLQEWVASCRVAASDKLGIRCSGRLRIRPRPPEDSGEDSGGYILEVGSPVDVWWHDGWWEAVVITADVSGTDLLQVYLPGEDTYMNIEKSRVRIAKDWVNGSWIFVKRKPGILSCISAKTKPTISDYDLPPSSELVEVKENRVDPPCAAALEPILTRVRDGLTSEMDLYKGENMDAEIAKLPLKELSSLHVHKDTENDGLDVGNDFGFARQRYDAQVQCVEPVS